MRRRRAIAASVALEEQARAPIDRGWTIAFIATLFAIHIGRMSTDFTLLGLASPAVAVLGDMFIAVVISLIVLHPIYLMWRAPTRWIERRLWRRHLTDLRAERSGWLVRATEAWLRWRLRFAIRMRSARYSIPATIGRGLQSGLPLAAILAATVPVWGMSWYFDTENWAAGMWNSWAESRTDTWREAMVRAVVAQNGAAGTDGLRRAPPDTRAILRSSSLVTLAKAMRRSRSFAINSFRSRRFLTCASSSFRRMSCIRPVR